jgi:hypothetical protein
MTRVSDPNRCGVCGEGLYEEGPTGQPQRIGQIALTGGNDAINEMNGSQEQKREAKRGFGLRVGFCPDCLDEYDMGLDDWGNLSDIYDQISLNRTRIVPEKDRRK